MNTLQRFTATLSGSLVVATSALLAQDTSLRVEVGSAGFVRGEKIGDYQLWIVEDDAAATTPFEAYVVLASASSECLENPDACDGGERTITEIEEGFVYGCNDREDNDGDGRTDASDPDCRGVQGWSVSVLANGCVSLEAATTRGTVSDLSIRPPGIRDTEAGNFEKTELVDPERNDGQRGAVSAVVLSFVNPIVLPPIGEAAILRLIGDVGEPCADVPLGCSLTIPPPEDPGLIGSGEPVKTAVTLAGETDDASVEGVAFTRAVCPGVEDCANDADDDGDGRIDCDDEDCRLFPPCRPPPEECDNGTDDDRDGLTDCADSDCEDEDVCREPEICDDGIDNDRDGRIDCRDSDCAPSDVCVEICDDGIDNDDDELVDCRDPGCDASPACIEICDDGIDNDDDGRIDCDDPKCGDAATCIEICDDGIDNDDDGGVDCQDSACATFPGCAELICDDAIDNDLDGLVDAQDPDCAASAGEICDDGIDNDDDGRIDCADLDCFGTAHCVEICDDAIDNDDDGRIDCADLDCRNEARCNEVCDDGVDNDADGRIDCRDPECGRFPACIEICDDAIDNDDDGRIDCRDPECAEAEACIEICDDVIDNDDDGLADCRDPECEAFIDCVEVCDDGIDNDDDGRIDCRDRGCDPFPGCIEICDDAVDNDDDGRIDCRDSTCLDEPLCRPARLDLELAFRFELIDPPAGGCSDPDLGTAPDGFLPIVAGLYLSSFSSDCLADPVSCSGGERTSPEPGSPSPGCSDAIDNDGDGLIDLVDPDCFGVQGWSVSVVADPCFGLWKATTRGTVGDPTTCPNGLRDLEGGNFERTELVEERGEIGALSAVVLSFTNHVILPPVSDSLILLLGGRMAGVAPAGGAEPCTLRVLEPDEEGLRGSGEPVPTGVTAGGESGVVSTGDLEVGAPSSRVRFVRGDPNDDGKVDLADAVWLVNELFRLGPETRCQDAGDANLDGMLDLSDAYFLVAYAFTHGPPPPPPFPACGPRFRESGLVCEAGAEGCPD